MARERRSNSKNQYYFRSKRVGKKVEKVYLGELSCPVVAAFANFERLEKGLTAGADRCVLEEQKKFAESDTELVRLEKLVQMWKKIFLLASGFELKNKQWGVIKMKTKIRRTAMFEAKEPLTREAFDHLVDQANDGERGAADQLRRTLEKHPEIWKPIGNLTNHVEESLISLITDGNIILEESLRLTIDELKTNLKYGIGNDLLEDMMIDLVIATRLETQFTIVAAHQAKGNLRHIRYWERRLENALKRHQAALKELATIRRLLAINVRG